MSGWTAGPDGPPRRARRSTISRGGDEAHTTLCPVGADPARGRIVASALPAGADQPQLLRYPYLTDVVGSKATLTAVDLVFNRHA